MVKMIDKEMLDALLDEWSQVKEQSDFTLDEPSAFFESKLDCHTKRKLSLCS